jgi:hypothetical protein
MQSRNVDRAGTKVKVKKRLNQL